MNFIFYEEKHFFEQLDGHCKFSKNVWNIFVGFLSFSFVSWNIWNVVDH